MNTIDIDDAIPRHLYTSNYISQSSIQRNYCTRLNRVLTREQNRMATGDNPSAPPSATDMECTLRDICDRLCNLGKYLRISTKEREKHQEQSKYLSVSSRLVSHILLERRQIYGVNSAWHQELLQQIGRWRSIRSLS
jgi:hypothetical protein